MDATTGVQSQQPSKPAWNAARAPGRPERQVAPPERPAEAGSRAGDERISVDPMRATDRYRLVMPYSEGV